MEEFCRFPLRAGGERRGARWALPAASERGDERRGQPASSLKPRPPQPTPRCLAKMREEGTIEDLGWDNEGDDDQYQELCNCRFSLAYGGKILLNNACLRLVGGC